MLNDLIETLYDYCNNKIPVNYNSIINTLKELEENNKINNYDTFTNMSDYNMKMIKIFEGEPSEKNGIPFDYTTLYDITITLLDDNDSCMIIEVEIR